MTTPSLKCIKILWECIIRAIYAFTDYSRIIIDYSNTYLYTFKRTNVKTYLYRGNCK